MGALGGAIYQLRSISITYFERKTTSLITLGYAPLPFPSITLCNINPIRLDKLDLASDDMKDFVESVKPDRDYEDRRRRRRSVSKRQVGMLITIISMVIL